MEELRRRVQEVPFVYRTSSLFKGFGTIYNKSGRLQATGGTL
jgi:hypothetical protein